MIREAIERFQRWRDRKGLLADAAKGAKALDIMLGAREWFGGTQVVEYDHPSPPVGIEVLIVDTYPAGKLSTFIPPRIGTVPVVVRFGKRL